MSGARFSGWPRPSQRPRRSAESARSGQSGKPFAGVFLWKLLWVPASVPKKRRTKKRNVPDETKAVWPQKSARSAKKNPGIPRRYMHPKLTKNGQSPFSLPSRGPAPIHSGKFTEVSAQGLKSRGRKAGVVEKQGSGRYMDTFGK